MKKFLSAPVLGVVGGVCGMALVLGSLTVAYRAASAAPQLGGGEPVKGDLNLDGKADLGDVLPFIQAIKDPGAWSQSYNSPANVLVAVGDFDGDGRVTVKDRHGFCNAVNPAGHGGGDGLLGGGDTTLPPEVDLDVDSDNDNPNGFPSRTTAEDAVEEDPPCKLLLLNEFAPQALEIVPDEVTPPILPTVTFLDYEFTYPASVRLREWNEGAPGDNVGSGQVYDQRVWIRGDMNADGAFDFGDLNPFVLAQSNFAQWQATYLPAETYPDMQERAHHIGDFNYDAHTDFGDVNPFVEAIASSAPARYVPVWTWIEGLQPSGAHGATEIMAAADTDNSGTIDQDDADPDTAVVTVHEAEYGSPPAWGAGRQISPFSVVNLRNGNVLTAIPIFGWNPVGPPVQFTLYHNSTVPQGGTGHGAWGFDLGEGWSVSYGAHIEGVWGDPQVTVVEDDGTRHVYVFEQNQYTAPPGVHDLLTWDGQEEQWALTTPGQWVSTFNDAGFLTSVTDNTGNTLAVHRTNGRIDYIASAADGLPDPDDPPNTISHKLELLYDQNGKLTEIQFDREDFILKWRFEYETSGAGRLRKVHYPDYCDPNVPNYDARFYVPASHVEITYEQGSDRIAAIYPRDATGATNRSDWDWQYAYQDGRLTSVNTPKRNAQEPNNPGDRYTESFTYSGPTAGLWTTTHTDRRGNAWLYRFDGVGNLRELTTPAAGPNNTRSATYDADHNLLTRTDELGHTWTYTYGPVGNVETITSPLTTPYTQTWTLTWEWPNGHPANLRRLVKVQDPADGANDFVVQYEYEDPNHPTLVTGVVEPADGEGNGEATTEITYYFHLLLRSEHAQCPRPASHRDRRERRATRVLVRQVGLLLPLQRGPLH